MGIKLSKVNDSVRINGLKISQYPSSKKIDISMIGNPTDFRHTYHVGSDSLRSEKIVVNSIDNGIDTPKTEFNNLSSTIYPSDLSLNQKESTISMAWTEPTVCSETFRKDSILEPSDLLFKDAVDAKIIELISKKHTRTRVLNGNLGSNNPRLMI